MEGKKEINWDTLGFEAGMVFTPSAPIDEKSLFAGRKEQLRKLIDAVSQVGQHAIVYGERGVGKTSLVNVVAPFLEGIGSTILAPRINCDVDDNFSKLWKKIFSEVKLSRKVRKIGYEASHEDETFSISDGLDEVVSPHDVRVHLTQLSQGSTLIIIIDEFDRVEDGRLKQQFADTIKALSDYAVSATVVIVGVADTVNELIVEHESVERSLVQIRMPRMSPDELKEILKKGLGKLRMNIEIQAEERIVLLSRGLPHYVHLLSLYAVREAIDKRQLIVTLLHVKSAISKAIDNAQQSIQKIYYDATVSTKKKSIYPPLLLACALAETDQYGFFTAADVRGPLSKIMNKEYDIPNFAKQLHELCEKKRGPVLKKDGVKHRYRFRFINPLLQPYIIMRDLKEIPNTQETLKFNRKLDDD